MVLKALLACLVVQFQVVTSLECYWCSGVGKDRQCETSPNNVSTGPVFINCKTKYCISSKVIDAATGDVKSFARLCDNIPRGNLCVRDKHLVTCFETCTSDMCNDGNPDPSYLSMQTHSNAYLGLPELGMHVRKDFAYFDTAHKGHSHALNTPEPMASSDENSGLEHKILMSSNQKSMNSKDQELTSLNLKSGYDQSSKDENDVSLKPDKIISNSKKPSSHSRNEKQFRLTADKSEVDDDNSIRHQATGEGLKFNYHANHVLSDALHIGMKPDDNKAIREHIQKYLRQQKIKEQQKGKQWWENSEKVKQKDGGTSSSLYSPLASGNPSGNSRRTGLFQGQRQRPLKSEVTATPATTKDKELGKKEKAPKGSNFGLFHKGNNNEKMVYFKHSPGYLSSITVQPIHATNFSKSYTNTRHPRYHASPFSSNFNKEKSSQEKDETPIRRSFKQRSGIESSQKNSLTVNKNKPNPTPKSTHSKKQNLPTASNLGIKNRETVGKATLQDKSKGNLKDSASRGKSRQGSVRTMRKQGVRGSSVKPTTGIHEPTSSYHRMSQYSNNGKKFLPYKSVYMSNLERKTDQESKVKVNSKSSNTDKTIPAENTPKVYVTKLIGRKLSGDKGHRIYKYWLKPSKNTEENSISKSDNAYTTRSGTDGRKFSPTVESYSTREKWWLKPTAESRQEKSSLKDQVQVKSYKYPRNSRPSPSLNLRRKTVRVLSTTAMDVQEKDAELELVPSSHSSVESFSLNNPSKGNENIEMTQGTVVRNGLTKHSSQRPTSPSNISNKGVKETRGRETDFDANHKNPKTSKDVLKKTTTSKKAVKSNVDRTRQTRLPGQERKHLHKAKTVEKTDNVIPTLSDPRPEKSVSRIRLVDRIHGRVHDRTNKLNTKRFEREHRAKSYRSSLESQPQTERQNKIPNQRKHKTHLQAPSILNNNNLVQMSDEDVTSTLTDKSKRQSDVSDVNGHNSRIRQTTSIITTGVRSIEDVNLMNNQKTVSTVINDPKSNKNRQPKPSQSRDTVKQKQQNTEQEIQKTIEITTQMAKLDNRLRTNTEEQDQLRTIQNMDNDIPTQVNDAGRDEQVHPTRPQIATTIENIMSTMNNGPIMSQKSSPEQRHRTNNREKVTPTQAKPSPSSQKDTQAPHWVHNFRENGVQIHLGKLMSDQMPLETHSKKIADPALQRSLNTQESESVPQGLRNIVGTSSPLQSEPVTVQFSSESEATTVKTQSEEVLENSFQDFHKELTRISKGWLSPKGTESGKGDNTRRSPRSENSGVTRDQSQTTGGNSDRLSKKYPTPTIYMSRNLHRPGKSEKLEGSKRQLFYTPMMNNVSGALYSSNWLAVLFLLIAKFILL